MAVRPNDSGDRRRKANHLKLPSARLSAVIGWMGLQSRRGKDGMGMDGLHWFDHWQETRLPRLPTHRTVAVASRCPSPSPSKSLTPSNSIASRHTRHRLPSHSSTPFQPVRLHSSPLGLLPPRLRFPVSPPRCPLALDRAIGGP